MHVYRTSGTRPSAVPPARPLPVHGLSSQHYAKLLDLLCRPAPDTARDLSRRATCTLPASGDSSAGRLTESFAPSTLAMAVFNALSRRSADCSCPRACTLRRCRRPSISDCPRHQAASKRGLNFSQRLTGKSCGEHWTACWWTRTTNDLRHRHGFTAHGRLVFLRFCLRCSFVAAHSGKERVGEVWVTRITSWEHDVKETSSHFNQH